MLPVLTEAEAFDRARRRGPTATPELAVAVAEILAAVRERGDEALLAYVRRFDAPNLTTLRVTEEEIESARIAEDEHAAIRTAVESVRSFHAAQRDVFLGQLESGRWRLDGRDVGQRVLPLRRVAVYVPGGRAAYPSSVVMNAVPALVAGVDEVVVTTPARADGTLHPAVLVALREVGVRTVFKLGGAVAAGAVAYGTETVPRADKLVGPGNAWLTEAKRQLWGTIGLDGYAGPSEVCVVVDGSANAAFAAADLLTQVEHAPDNSAFLIALGEKVLDAVRAEVARQIAVAPRADILRTALAERSFAVVAPDIASACALVDAIAPEHCTLSVADPEEALARIRNASCLLLGEWTPESAGDYALGPSHTLPTEGAARWQSPLNVLDFVKLQSVAQLDRTQLAEIRSTIETLGRMEGFAVHARGAGIRFEE